MPPPFGAETRARIAAAVRSLARPLRRATVPCAVLAGAVAAGQTVVAIREAVLSRPLPYPDPAAVVQLEVERDPEDPRVAAGFGHFVTIHEAALLREHAALVAGFASWSETWASVGSESGRPVRVVRAHPGLLATLGVRPTVGAPFFPEQYAAAAERPPAVLLGHGLWRRLGGSPETPVPELTLNAVPTPVAGVMPADFFFPDPDAAAWIPAPDREPTPRNRGSAQSLLGRLAPGATPAAAAAELTAILRNGGELRANERIRVTRLAEVVTAGSRPALDLLLLGALLLTLTASVSVTALRLSEMLAQRVAAATRRALGATWKDELRAALARVALRALLVAATAGLLSSWLLLVSRRVAGALLFPESWQLSPASLGAGLGLSVLAVALAEAPAVLGALRHPARLVEQDPLAPGTRLLAPSYLAFGTLASTALLIVALSFSLRAFDLLRGLGSFPAEGLAQLTVDFAGDERSPRHEERTAALERAAARLGAMPEVLGVSYADALPDAMGRIQFPASGGFRPGAPVFSKIRVGPGLLEVLGVEVLAGRGLLRTDAPPAEPVAVVSRAFARREAGDSPDRTPDRMPDRMLDRTVGDRGAEARVVGVAAEVLRFPAQPAPPAAYIPFAAPTDDSFPIPRAEIVARLDRRVRPEDTAAFAREAALASPALRVLRAASVRDRRARLLGGNLLAGALVAFYAAVAALLAVVSTMGLVLETAARRERQLAIHHAVGAPPDAIVLETARRSGLAAGLGVALGVLGGWLLLRVVAGRLAWVETGEWTLYAGPAALLGITLLLAGAATGLRALRRNPWAALRSL